MRQPRSVGLSALNSPKPQRNSLYSFHPPKTSITRIDSPPTLHVSNETTMSAHPTSGLKAPQKTPKTSASGATAPASSMRNSADSRRRATSLAEPTSPARAARSGGPSGPAATAGTGAHAPASGRMGGRGSHAAAQKSASKSTLAMPAGSAPQRLEPSAGGQLGPSVEPTHVAGRRVAKPTQSESSRNGVGAGEPREPHQGDGWAASVDALLRPLAMATDAMKALWPQATWPLSNAAHIALLNFPGAEASESSAGPGAVAPAGHNGHRASESGPSRQSNNPGYPATASDAFARWIQQQIQSQIALAQAALHGFQGGSAAHARLAEQTRALLSDVQERSGRTFNTQDLIQMQTQVISLIPQTLASLWQQWASAMAQTQADVVGMVVDEVARAELWSWKQQHVHPGDVPALAGLEDKTPGVEDAAWTNLMDWWAQQWNRLLAVSAPERASNAPTEPAEAATLLWNEWQSMARQWSELMLHTPTEPAAPVSDAVATTQGPGPLEGEAAERPHGQGHATTAGPLTPAGRRAIAAQGDAAHAQPGESPASAGPDATAEDASNPSGSEKAATKRRAASNWVV
jgi:hypothetical protein